MYTSAKKNNMDMTGIKFITNQRFADEKGNVLAMGPQP